MNLLSVHQISKRLEHGTVLKNINFLQQSGQKIAIAGETGSGKSTLLKIIAGLIQPDNGEVWFQNRRVVGPEEKLIAGHSDIAYLSQYFELRNNYRVEELLEMANKMPVEEAQRIYDICKIPHLLKRKTDRLSGGEKQRIAVAKLLITSPKMLLLDEPYSNLDMPHRNILKKIINDIVRKLKITCILISHDPLDTLSWADEIVVMKAGEIIQIATPRQIYKQPVNEYVAGLFGSYNVLSNAQAAEFKIPPSPNLHSKYAFIRPDDLLITSKQIQTVAAEVNKVDYYGSYSEIEVVFAQGKIAVKTNNEHIKKGDTVHVSLKSASVWYI